MTTGCHRLSQQPDFIQAGNNLLNATVAARWQRKVLTTLATYHEQHQDEPGPGRERLRRMALPMEDDALVLLLIEKMRESGVIQSHHGWLHLPDHKAGFTPAQDAIWQKAAPLFGDEPWWVRDLAQKTGTGRAANAPGIAPFSAAGSDYRDRERSLLPQRSDRDVCQFDSRVGSGKGSTCAADFRDRLNVGRKLAIQILVMLPTY